MSRINEKLGLKPAGTRNMMKLPDDRALRNAVTSAVCPHCSRRGARLSKVTATERLLWCSWCHQTWPLTLPENPT